jgi:hypothetical protein
MPIVRWELGKLKSQVAEIFDERFAIAHLGSHRNLAKYAHTPDACTRG